MSTPFVYRNGKWRGSITIDIKPGKYRVTISGMNIDAGTMDTGFGLEQINTTASALFLNKSRDKFKNTEWLNLYNTEFMKAFTVKNVDSDW